MSERTTKAFVLADIFLGTILTPIIFAIGLLGTFIIPILVQIFQYVKARIKKNPQADELKNEIGKGKDGSYICLGISCHSFLLPLIPFVNSILTIKVVIKKRRENKPWKEIRESLGVSWSSSEDFSPSNKDSI